MSPLLARRLLVIGAGGVGIALVIVLGIAMRRGVGDSPLGRTDAGFSVAREFTLPTFDGAPFVLADHAAGPLFLYFWASWCRPCEEEAPIIERLWPEYRARGVTFVAINILDAERDARAFIARHGLSFPLLRDVEGKVYLDYGVYGLPEAFFLRPGLRVSEKYNGALTERELRAMLARLLEGS